MFALVGCGFTGRGTDGADAAVDAAVDAAPDVAGDAAPPFCPADPHLRVCFSFDDEVAPGVLPNQGGARVDAAVANVGYTTSERSGAAVLTEASSIFVPMHPDVSGVLATEVWFKIDTQPANDGRAGLWDSNVSPPNISLFVFRVDPAHQRAPRTSTTSSSARSTACASGHADHTCGALRPSHVPNPSIANDSWTA